MSQQFTQGSSVYTVEHFLEVDEIDVKRGVPFQGLLQDYPQGADLVCKIVPFGSQPVGPVAVSTASFILLRMSLLKTLLGMDSRVIPL